MSAKKILNQNNLIYLYCVTDRVPNLKVLENFRDAITIIPLSGLYAVTSEVSTDEFGEEGLKANLADFEWVKTKASMHQKVIEAVMKDATVIPFKFGALFNNESSLKAMLESRLKIFKDTLIYLQDKEERGVKIYCDMERLKEDLLGEDKKLQELDKEINSSSSGKAFILKKKKEDLIGQTVTKKINDYGQESFERLREHSVRYRINKLLSKEATEKNEDMILNSAFLIEKNKITDFINTLDELKTSYVPRGLLFDCTGPWPAYNFCETQIYGAKRT